VSVRESRDRDSDLFPALEALGARKAWDIFECERRALSLHAVDELHEFARASEVPQEDVFLGHALGWIASQSEEARDPGIQKLTDERARLRVRRSDTREVGHRPHVGVLE
jgi:hypothetical protein